MEFNPCNRLNQPMKRSGVKIIPKTFSDADLVRMRDGTQCRHWLRITP